jgi:hypothetical protein
MVVGSIPSSPTILYPIESPAIIYPYWQSIPCFVVPISIISCKDLFEAFGYAYIVIRL